MIIFLVGMACGSFSSTLVILFFQGAYRDDRRWQVECDEQYLEENKKNNLS